MDQLEYKEGVLFIGGQLATDMTRAVIAALSAYTGKDLKTTCDLLNQLLQSFDMFCGQLKEYLKPLAEAFTEILQDICEPCRHRGTWHGSSIEQLTPKRAKANIKWWERYRPP